MSARTDVGALTRADVEAAASRITPFVTRTPLIASPWISAAAKSDVFLKLESVQVTGSFKARGAINALLMLRERRPDVTTVVTASAGNHGQALAWAGHRLGVTVRVHLPASAPRAKRDGLARFGATPIDATSYEAAELNARDDARASGAPYVSPYNDADVIAGAGTVALEMFEDVPELDTIIAPIGGGGLLSGIAIVSRSLGREIFVVGAEAEASPVFTSSIAAGRVTTVSVQPSLADGLTGNMESDSQTFDIVRRLVDRVVSVAEPSFARAMRELIQREQLVTEAAGAAGVAAILQGAVDVRGRRVGVVLSGRNVDADVIARVLLP